MSTNRQRFVQMQEALDEMLSEEDLHDLRSHLDEDTEASQSYNKLERVHTLLSNAPTERAPQRLAATIMARLAESVKAQTQAQVQLTEVTSESIAVALSLVTVVTMPMMVAVSWLMVHAAMDPEFLTLVLQQIIALMVLMIEMLQVFLDEALSIVKDDPNAAAALLSLIPVTLLMIARYFLGDPDAE